MKRTNLIIWIVPLLTAIALMLYKQNKDSSLSSDFEEFHYSDTGSITKIFMANINGDAVTLEKKTGGTWKINNKYIARPESIDLLLQTIYQQRIKAPVGKNAEQNVIKWLATGATKVELYIKKKKVKCFYVGGPTQNHLGTYMLLEHPKTGNKAEKPFIIHIPGFDGYLSTRFFIDEQMWRHRQIISYHHSEIEKVIIKDFEAPGLSFTLLNNTPPVIIDINNVSFNHLDSIFTNRYLGYFRNIQYESIENNMSEAQVDSVFMLDPYITITVSSIDGSTDSISTFLKQPPKGSFDLQGNPLTYDPDRLYARFNSENELLILQYFVIDPIRSPVSQFINEEELDEVPF